MINRRIRRGANLILDMIIVGILLPFVGTVTGAAMVFFTKRGAGEGLHRAIEGFSAGVMIAASVWSLLIPSMEMTKGGRLTSCIPAVTGFFIGIVFFLLCDKAIDKSSFLVLADANSRNRFITCFAVALHNLPEGMAVGAVFADILCNGELSGISAAMALSIGIAVQNIPEGAIMSVPIYAGGATKLRSFGIGVLSGAVEPVGAFLTILAAGIAVPLLPYLLGFAAGAMVYAVLDSFDAGENKTVPMLTFAMGFAVMMCLDVILG